MKTACLLLLTMFAIGCGYSSSGKGTQAAGAPTIMSLVPASSAAGGAAFSLKVMGSGFVNGAVVYWNAATRTTTFVSTNEVDAAITATDIATSGTELVYVKNPGGTGIYMNQGGQSSATVQFSVTP